MVLLKFRGTVSMNQKFSEIAKMYFSAACFPAVLGSSNEDSLRIRERKSLLVRPSNPWDL